MRSLISFILLIICISTTVLAQQNWYEQELSDQITVHFPKKPELTRQNGTTVYNYTDEQARYMMLILDLSNQDDFKITTKEELDEFYDGYLKGVLKRAEGEIISKKEINIAGLKAADLGYTATNPPDAPGLRYERILLANKKLYACNFWTSPEQKEATRGQRKQFFDSFTVQAADTSLKQYTTENRDRSTAYQMGKSVGSILGVLLVIGAIIGAGIFLVRKIKS